MNGSGQIFDCDLADLGDEPGDVNLAKSDERLATLKSLHPKLIDLSLGRIERLLARLGNPHHKLPPVIHIAGTNGKGSVTAFLRAMLEADGQRVHAYTSPHLVRFHERIVLAGNAPGEPGAPIGEDALVDILTRTEAINAGDDITQFEITTAAALLAFAERPADVVLLEVGLGGRLDATNVIDRPALCVITPVSMDHAEKLGATLPLIAREKAGILKRGVTAVIAEQDPLGEAAIVETAAAVAAPLLMWGQDFQSYEQNGRLVVQLREEVLDLPMPGLIGRHQIGNAGTAVAAALTLGGISEPAIARGLVDVRWPARFQRLAHGPLPDLLSPACELWLDGGHNPAGGEALARTLADLEDRVSRPLHLVVGMMGLKDIHGFLVHFRGLAKSVTAVPIPGAHEAPHAPEAVAGAAAAVGIPTITAASVAAALRALQRGEPGPKRVLICGSLYLAGQVLAQQEGVEAQSN